jgi:Ca-activated chloride channel family protein
MRFADYDPFYLFFLLVFPIVPAYLWYFWRKKQMLDLLAEAPLLSAINTSVSRSKQILKATLLIAGFAAVVFALTRPAWNPKPREIKRKGRDVVILLDVSRSMLAEDIKPNRLGRAKIAIKDLMEQLRGDRIGIVTFAGNSSVKSPLTQDYAFVRMAIDRLTTESTTRGGTNVLITDCDDQAGSFPEKAAEQAGQKGIRIIAVGLGNPNEGARIPIVSTDGTKTFLKYNSQEVWTKLDDKTLRKIASATGGAYIPVETGTFDLGQIYLDLIRSAGKRELESATILEYDEKFQIFLALGLLCLIGEVFVSECVKK